MFKAALTLCAALAPAAAFAPARPRAGGARALGATQGIAGVEKRADGMSQCLPFLKCPPKLDGSMVGDVGFDPMGLSDVQPDLKYARAAELKHGRICMLATIGFVFQARPRARLRARLVRVLVVRSFGLLFRSRDERLALPPPSSSSSRSTSSCRGARRRRTRSRRSASSASV